MNTCFRTLLGKKSKGSHYALRSTKNMKYLVGNTGFVGSNIARSGDFDGLFHTTNIADAYGAKPELLVYAGLRAEKYLANKDPERDMVMIDQAFQNICRIEPQKLVLISSVDVYKQP